jgi:hypothetical protein
MSYHDRLRDEINEKLNRLTFKNEPWVAQWIANEICNAHGGGLVDNDHRDFWLHAGYTHCRREVTACINRRAGDRADRTDEQIIMPGYSHLHAYYVVTRDGVDVGIPVGSMTDGERAAKASLYRSMGAACYAHADELEKFDRDREQAA